MISVDEHKVSVTHAKITGTAQEMCQVDL